MTRRPLKPGDRALWERVARTVTPLKTERQLAPKTPPAMPLKPPEASPAPPKMPAPASPAVQNAGKPPAPRVSDRTIGDLDRKERRRLARGAAAIEARIDLHGMTQDEAHAALNRFVMSSQASGRRVVLVITGKGRGGEGAGILRRAVPHWLTGRELGRLVVGYGPASALHGGDGALYVRLRSKAKVRRP
ncbi:Smr/MutS family protein [Acuticoccus sp. MNP-M23]|uniref:Smr/MutS family protein n=1 Tax=Acuticoccus sp. MNP-M23 TaxID=3072793 RepID=UPI002816307C|nr:Smr/MutS family protein [Acuticoccus sp. MNP-M23]WMS44328.1 Smr/MutS family protein [Acuticoccus sp. MNP-M23]